MSERVECPECGMTEGIVGQEYDKKVPEHVDGVSEWHCLNCKTRWGRWTGKILQKGEREPRYGRVKA